jgi:imidazolonepropionase
MLLTNVGQLVVPENAAPARGRRMRAVDCIFDAAVFVQAGKIARFGAAEKVLADAAVKNARPALKVIDCGGRVVTPGLVDPHTHPVFMRPRLVDFEQRIQGASYEQIAKAGGGIRSSVDPVRLASVDALAQAVLAALDRMLEHGTTTVECKSGYGLRWDAEQRSLLAIRAASQKWPGTVVATFLGAHVVPKEFQNRRKEYVTSLCRDMIPLVAREGLAKYVDVFIERGAFTAAEAEQIFAAAAAHGLQVRAHVGQLSPADLKPLFRFQPASLDHLDYISAKDRKLLGGKASGTIAILVPGANYFLGGKSYPDARALIDAGAPVALATDYNPGTSPLLNMQMAMSLACTQLRMTPAEAIVASTLNAAASLGLGDAKGRVANGAHADFAIFDCEDYREIPYWFGSNRCWMSIVRGNVAWTQTS